MGCRRSVFWGSGCPFAVLASQLTLKSIPTFPCQGGKPNPLESPIYLENPKSPLDTRGAIQVPFGIAILKTKQPAGFGGLFRFRFVQRRLSRADWEAAYGPHRELRSYWSWICWRVLPLRPSPQQFFPRSFGFWSSRRPLMFHR